MLLKEATWKMRNEHIRAITPEEAGNHQNGDNNKVAKEELRRRMYERIAQGNALSEAEAVAHRKWRRH